MNRKFHRYLINAFSARSESDYLAVPEATEKSALLMNEQAKEYLTSSKRLFKNLIIDNNTVDGWDQDILRGVGSHFP